MSTYFSITAGNTVDQYSIPVTDVTAPANIMAAGGEIADMPTLLSFHYNGHTYWNVEYLQKIKDSKDNRLYKDWMEEILKSWKDYSYKHGNNAQ